MAVGTSRSSLPARIVLGVACAIAALAVVSDAPAATGIRGVDVSHFNTTLPVDWLSVANSGVSFIFAKATEGTTITDPTYGLNRSAAETFGIRVGAYHFARPGGSSIATITADALGQASYFVGVAQPAPGDLPPVLDLEATGNLSPANLGLWTQTWLDDVFAQTGVRPFVYVSPHFWQTALGDTSAIAAAGYPLWIAHWTGNAAPTLPALGWNGLGWTFWQWSDCSTVPGFVHCVDADRFAGLDLTPLLIPATPATIPVVATPPTIVGAPQIGKVLAALPGSWNGGKPVAFTYQWESCDATGAGCAPIAGATSENYKPVATDSGHELTVLVTAQNSTSEASASSVATPAISGTAPNPTPTPTPVPVATAPVATVPPSVEGTPQIGQTLTIVEGGWSVSPSTFAYQWQRCDTSGESCTPIPGATQDQYTLTPADLGATVTILETVTAAGSSASISAEPTGVVTKAPAAPPTGRTAVVQGAVAGAVATLDQAATVSWQPGAVPIGAIVSVAHANAKLALPGTAFSVNVTRVNGQLPWPIDLQFAPSLPHGVIGFSTDDRTWQAVPKLATPELAPDQNLGTYRDGSGHAHVLMRYPGFFAFFAGNKWGDPRLIATGPPLLPIGKPAPMHGRAQRDGTLRIIALVALQSQAHLYASLLGPSGKQIFIARTGSRLGAWLHGTALKTVQSLVLAPGATPIRLNVRLRALTPKTTYRLQILAVDPLGRRSTVDYPVRFGY